MAAAAGVAQSGVSTLERGLGPADSLRALCRVLDAVGLELSVRAYPASEPIRDAAQIRTLTRLRHEVGARWRWALEEPLPTAGDRRAWDAVIRRDIIAIAIEVETRPRDVQALLRRLALKRRDGGIGRLILALPDTRWNRSLIGSHGELLATAFPIPHRHALAAVRAGTDPGGDAIVLV